MEGKQCLLGLPGNPKRDLITRVVKSLVESSVMATMPGGEGDLEDRAPLILTALEISRGLMVYCPVCNKDSPIEEDMPDKKIACPQEKCKGTIKLNPFTVRREV